MLTEKEEEIRSKFQQPQEMHFLSFIQKKPSNVMFKNSIFDPSSITSLNHSSDKVVVT